MKESALTSATLYRLTDGAERFFWRLILTADDFGRFEADPDVMRSRCFPRWPAAKMSTRRVGHFYGELEGAELVKAYAVRGVLYGYFVTWDKHQQRRAQRSKYPEPTSENTIAASASIGNHLPANVPVFVFEESRLYSRSEFDNPSPAGQEPPTWGSVENLIELYNELVPADHPHVTRLSPARRDKARRYLRAFPDRKLWVRAFTEIKHSRFLLGLVKRDGHDGFRGDFDWLLTKGKDGTENVVKVAEGKYRDEDKR